MSTERTSGRATASAMEHFARIRAEMAVVDATGERFGRVTDVCVETPVAIAGGVRASAGAPQAPDLPAELLERLRRVGYIKIEDTRHFRRDFRYYATIDQVSSVDASVVRLDGRCRDLITVFE